MDKVILDNGVKIIYMKAPSDITSFTIGFEAGANEEEEHQLGLAHMVEHMVFKGTEKLNEQQINERCNKYFGFHNAMTNYPYVVYYGSCLQEDFNDAFSLYSDIVFRPAFREEGFKEEVGVILEELKDWSDDPQQHCEDMLFYNSFKKRRIKELIIGREELINSYTIDDVKEFYRKYYTTGNCVISVVSSIPFDEVLSIVKNNFSHCQCVNNKIKDENLYENPISGIYREENPHINGGKVQYIFPIHDLSVREIALLHMFNEYFASGTSSLLYDEIRTKRGLVYDIQGNVKKEKGIKLYSITMSASRGNLTEAIGLIDDNIEKVLSLKGIFNEELFMKYRKSQNLKRMLSAEKSIVMAMNLAVYEIMFNDASLYINEFKNLEFSDDGEMDRVISKVLRGKSTEILA